MSEIFVGPLCCVHNNLHGTEQCGFLFYFSSCTLLNTTEESPLGIQPQDWWYLLRAEDGYSPKSVGLLRGEIYFKKTQSNKEENLKPPTLCQEKSNPTLES